jgi:uncharacterized membrane protein YczE
MKTAKNFQCLLIRWIYLAVGLSIMAFGVAFSVKAALGTSPISSLPYVTGVLSGLSVGITTIIINSMMVAIQILLLRKRFQPFQLLQILAAVVFGLMIDVGNSLLAGISISGYPSQWIFCLIGIVLVAFGVAIEVTARLVTLPGEGTVLAVCQILPVKFGIMKVAFDVTLVVLSAILSLACLGRLEGVREGTVAAALCVGLLSRQFIRPLKRLPFCASAPVPSH